MNGWVILVDHSRDFPNAETPHKVITTSDYLARPKLFVGRRARQDHQPVALLQLSVQGLLRLAAGRGARAPHHPDRRDHARAARAQALRAVAARSAGGAQPSPRIAPAPTRRRPSICCSASASCQDPRFEAFGRLLFDWYRCPAIEVTITPGKRWKIDRLRAAPARQARPRGGGVLSRRAAPAHPTRLAQPARARRRQIFARRALRSRRRSCRRRRSRSIRYFQKLAETQFGRRRTADQAAARGTGRIRRAVHPRDDLDRQLHLSLRAPRAAGGHAGHRRSGVDDPLHQQGLSARTDGGARRSDPADRHAGRGRRPRQGREAARLADGGEDPRRLVLARRPQGRRSSRR